MCLSTSRPTSSVKSKSSAKRDGNETTMSANNSLISNTSIRKSETINCNESFVKSVEKSSNSPTATECAEMSVKNDEDDEFKSDAAVETAATSFNNGTDIDEIKFQISPENFTPSSDEKYK